MNIYVGNLSYSSTENEIRNLFEAFGTVSSVKLIIDRETGRAKGFGFVEMPDAEATKAISALNGSTFATRELVVNEARQREQGSYQQRNRY